MYKVSGAAKHNYYTRSLPIYITPGVQGMIDKASHLLKVCIYWTHAMNVNNIKCIGAK